MSPKAKDIDKTTPLKILDPELPFLASKAAIELDNLILGKSIEFDSVHILATKLKNSFEIDNNNGMRRSLIDPTMLTLIGDAINEIPEISKVTNVKELVDKAMALANDLLEKEEKKKKKGLEWKRDFCVALSRLTSDYHKSKIDLRPSHPYRSF